MKKHVLQLTKAKRLLSLKHPSLSLLSALLVLSVLFLLPGCSSEKIGEEPTEEAETTLNLDEVTRGNDSSDEAVQAILTSMLGDNRDPDAIIYDLVFASVVDSRLCNYTVIDSDVISSTGEIHPITDQDTTVSVYVKYRGGECYFDFTVLSADEASYTLLENAADDLLHNTDNVRGNITLLSATGVSDDISIQWTSSNTDVITDKATGDDGSIPAGVVTRGDEDTSVTLTAVLTYGDYTITREYEMNVIAKPEEVEYPYYVYTYFQGNVYGTGESQNIFMATSEDGFFWEALNNDKYILEATEGTGGVRDSFLLRSAEGDHFYLIGTDLDANGGDWAAYGNEGSRNICVWESDDLVNWTEERLVPLAAEGANCMWAPEATYDPTTGEYVVYWAGGVNGTPKQIWYAKTRDFYTFTEPEVYRAYDTCTYIDTTMIEYEGTYYRFTKNENELTIFLETSDAVLGDFTMVKEEIAGETGVEGPAIYQVYGEETWVLYMDGYANDNSGVGYFPLIADSLEDLQTGNFRRLESDEYEMPLGAKHGSFVPISQTEYDALMNAWGN